MGLGILQKKGGSSRKYIFKDGVFKITPKNQSGWTLQSDGTLKQTSASSNLLIPYLKSGEYVIVKMIGNNGSGDAAILFSTITTGATSPFGYDNTVYFRHSMKCEFCFGMHSENFIWIKTLYEINYTIKEIWTEKIGGGGLTNLLTFIKHLFNRGGAF